MSLNINLSKKYKILIGIMAVLSVIAICFLIFYKSHKPYNISNDQVKLSNSINNTLGFGIELKISRKINDSQIKNGIESNIYFSGKIDNKNNFIGGLGVSKDIISESLISKDSDTYIKQLSGAWKKQTTAYLIEKNLLTHPEWIQLQKKLPDIKIGGKKYLQYSVIFEKPNQKEKKTIPKEELELIQYKGTATLDPKTFQLKTLTLSQKQSPDQSYTLDYTTLTTPPIITTPKL